MPAAKRDADGERGERDEQRQTGEDIAPQVPPADRSRAKRPGRDREQVGDLVAGDERVPAGAVEEHEDGGDEGGKRVQAAPGEHVEEAAIRTLSSTARSWYGRWEEIPKVPYIAFRTRVGRTMRWPLCGSSRVLGDHARAWRR